MFLNWKLEIFMKEHVKASFQYKDCLSMYVISHHKDKAMGLSYLYNGNLYAHEMASLYWNNPKNFTNIPLNITKHYWRYVTTGLENGLGSNLSAWAMTMTEIQWPLKIVFLFSHLISDHLAHAKTAVVKQCARIASNQIMKMSPTGLVQYKYTYLPV